MTRVALAVLALTFGFVLNATAQDFRPPGGPGKVYFKNLKDGATVPSTVNMDGRPIATGEPVPLDDKDLHFGKGQTEGEITLPPGRHTLTLQFADGAHRSYGPKWAATITVNVKA